jgi:hypothetical protein
VDLHGAVVVDEAQLPEFVHEEADAGPGRANDLRQRFLADLHGNRLRSAFFAEIGQEEQRPSETLFTRIEQLIDQVRLDAAVARQKMSRE